MATNYNAVDTIYTWNGDYTTDGGDFADTSNDQLQSLIQEIQTIANSSLGDWEENPTYAASLDDFVGEPNNRDTARAITDRLTTSLIINNVVKADDLSVRVVPIARSKVLIIISVTAASTPENNLLQGEFATVSIVYDFVERGVMFLDAPLPT